MVATISVGKVRAGRDTPRAYVLGGSPPLLAAELAALERVVREVTRTLGPLLGEYLGRGCVVGMEAVAEQFTVGHSEAAASVWGIPGGADSQWAPVWRLDGALARGLVDVLLGAEAPRPALPGAGLTRVEARVLARLCRELHAGWSSCWPLRATWPDNWRCMMAEPDAPGPPSGEWVRLRLRLDACGLQGVVDAFVPMTMARLSLPAGGRGAAGAREVRGELRAAPVTATAVLGTWHTTLGELAELRVGQVVPLGLRPGAPLVLEIAGSPKLTVQAGMHGGLVAVQVVDGDG